MSDNITLPRDVAEKIFDAFGSEVYPPAASTEWYDIMDAFRTALAAPSLEVTVDPRLTPAEAAAISSALAAEQPKPEPVAWQCREHGDSEWADCSKEAYGINPSRYVYRRLYAAPQPEQTHPGYIIGSHWLETAYSRVCAGEAEADVLRDYGLVRVTDAEALRREAERYRYLRNRDPAEVLSKEGKDAGCWIDCEDDMAGLQLLTGDDADTAIDAALQEDKT